jgi:hypothetical protein
MTLTGTKLLPGTLPVLLILFSCVTCKQNRVSEERSSKLPQESHQVVFISRIISVQPGTELAFFNHLRDRCLPFWRELKDRRMLSEISVFEITVEDSSLFENPPWNYLILARFVNGIDSQQLLGVEESLKANLLGESPSCTIIRTEALSCTPNSYYPVPIPKHRGRIEEVDFLIEFIAVNESAQDLKRYQDLMRAYFGPANGKLVKDGILYNFIALETIEVFQQVEGLGSWNQIHISGDFPEYKTLDWDSLYTHLFRQSLSVELDSVWALLPQTRDWPPYYSGRLIQELRVE